MATFFGHKKTWRWRTASGPLRPPTPVAPRPPMTPNPKGQGMPTPMGNGQKSLTLPGPGPGAGGRYKLYYPGKPVSNVPSIPPAASSDWYGQGSYNQAMKRAAAWAIGRQIARMHPVGRVLDFGFSLMTGDWSITKPEGAPNPGGYDLSGWTQRCYTSGWPMNRWQSSGFISTPMCGTSFQVTMGAWGAGPISIPAGHRSLFVGNATLTPPVVGGRYTIRAHWTRSGTAATTIPWTAPSPGTPPGLSPAPNDNPMSWPEPYPESKPETRSNTRLAHDYGVTPRGDPRAGTGVRTQPAPYRPGGKPPPGMVYTPNLPRPGEKKWKMSGTGLLGDVYGLLTEAKDALKCVEKGMKGYRIPKGAGLTERIHTAAKYMHDNPNKVDWQGIGQCLIANHIEDAVIGKVNQLANRITESPYWKRPVGVGAGAWAVRMN